MIDRTHIVWLRRSLVVVAILALSAASVVAIRSHASLPDDLRLVVAKEGVTGRGVALFGVLFPFEGPPFVPRSSVISVRLVGEDHKLVATTTLTPARGLGASGHLSLRDVAPGTYTLVAAADHARTLSLPFEVREAGFSLAVSLQERPTLPVHRYAAFPARPSKGGVVPEPFGFRVLGGACTPGVVCLGVAALGGDPVSVRLEATDAVSAPEGSSSSRTSLKGDFDWLSPGTWSVPESDWVPFAFVPRSPDVQVTLTARVGEELQARRTFRLPMQLGGALISVDGKDRVVLAGVPEGTIVYVDQFAGGIWEHTVAVVATTGGHPLRQLFPAAGVSEALRLQARTDPFSAKNASAWLHGSEGLPARFERAADELLIARLPEARSSRPGRVEEYGAAADQVRQFGIVLVALFGVVAALFVLWRGVWGARVAREVHAKTEGTVPSRRSLAVRVLLSALLLLAAFLSLAAWFSLRSNPLF